MKVQSFFQCIDWRRWYLVLEDASNSRLNERNENANEDDYISVLEVRVNKLPGGLI